jgi:nucleotide-binding universal stress UspA family protein
VNTEPGPILIAYDGTPAADAAVRASGRLLAGRAALAVTVWKAGLGFDLVALPTTAVGLPPAQIDVRTALEVDRVQMEHAQRLAEHGAQLAHDSGFGDTDGVAVADDPDIAVAETLIQVARERRAEAMVIGLHRHGPGALALDATPRDVIRNAPCPVVVARDPAAPAPA